MRLSLTTLALAAALGLPTALAAAPAPQASEVRQTATLKAPAAARQQGDAAPSAYAQREAQAKDLESFTGGRKDDVIYVGAGAILLVVLILILI